jgi:outer membrane lipoprotein
MNIRICTFLVAFFLAGCQSFPDKLQLDDTNQLVTYEDASSKAEQVKGKMVRWGGVIAKVENKADSTVFEMVYYPLNGYGRPISGEESIGRFRIRVNGFMDPMVYQVGRLMTFTAQLNGLETGLVGEHEYVFPTADVSAYYLWKNVQRVSVSGVHIWPHQFGYGYGGLYQNWYYPRHYRRNVIIRGSSSSNSNRVKSIRPSGATHYPKPVNTKRTER